MDDMELLQRYGAESSEEAFACLVSRHIHLVYSSALRQVRDAHLAEEIAQRVFVLLAKKAGSLGNKTILSGWLYRTTRFVASEALRTETRRRVRERKAMEPLYESSDRSPWMEIEPLLDEAMAGLGEKERNLVLLRYFENKSLKEVGHALGISEDAAQKRVARALEKLRAYLGQRGVSVSATGLTAALSTLALPTAPASLAASVLSAVAVSSSAITPAVVTQITLKAISMSKIKIAAVTAVVLATASVPLIWQPQILKRSQEENLLTAQEKEIPAAAPTPAVVARPDEAELDQLRRDAAEVHRLRGEVGLLLMEKRDSGGSNPGPGTNDRAPSTQTNPMDRMKVARELMAKGQHAEALEHYLWCYDQGLLHSPAFVGVRGSFLLSELSELGRVYPPAREALMARRDAAESEITSGPSDPRAVHDLIQLNKHLGAPDRTMALFDRLPADHAARSRLADLAAEEFISARRYKEVVEAGNPEGAFDRLRFAMSRTTNAPSINEMQQASLRRMAVANGARGVEALAGAGQTERANALADQVIQFDNSPETRGQLLQHASRAGNERVIAHINGK